MSSQKWILHPLFTGILGALITACVIAAAAVSIDLTSGSNAPQVPTPGSPRAVVEYAHAESKANRLLVESIKPRLLPPAQLATEQSDRGDN